MSGTKRASPDNTDVPSKRLSFPTAPDHFQVPNVIRVQAVNRVVYIPIKQDDRVRDVVDALVKIMHASLEDSPLLDVEFHMGRMYQECPLFPGANAGWRKDNFLVSPDLAHPLYCDVRLADIFHAHPAWAAQPFHRATRAYDQDTPWMGQTDPLVMQFLMVDHFAPTSDTGVPRDVYVRNLVLVPTRDYNQDLRQILLRQWCFHYQPVDRHVTDEVPHFDFVVTDMRTGKRTHSGTVLMGPRFRDGQERIKSVNDIPSCDTTNWAGGEMLLPESHCYDTIRAYRIEIVRRNKAKK